MQENHKKDREIIKAGLKPPDGLRWLYVDFNSYFASVEQQLKPHLRGRPIAVVPVASDATCAIAASYEAKAFGIKTGTPIYEARKLCPQLVCVLGQHRDYVAFHERILTEINRHIPVHSVCSIDEMACRLFDNETSLDKALSIAHAIKKGIADNIGAYVRCSIGIAPNKYLAKIATDMQKPDGLTILQPADIPDKLRVLALDDFSGIGRNMARRLARARIYTVDDLLALSPKHLRAVWRNIHGERFWYLLRGYELPEIPSERRSIGHSHVLAPEIRPPDQARYVARRLLMKACARLRRMGFCCRVMTLSIRIEQGDRIGLETRLSATQDSFALLERLEKMWDMLILRGAPARIKAVNITLSGLCDTDSVNIQSDLFTPLSENRESPIAPSKQKPESLCQAIDGLNMKYGRNTVLIGQTPEQGKSFTGTKVAFTRIPDFEEFRE